MSSAAADLKALDPTTAAYFYGRMSRHEAERILTERGLGDGLYLLRLSLTQQDNYALAVCSERRIHHYTIDRQPDGQVRISGGKKFPGPLELVKYHRNAKDGLVEKTKLPCTRPDDMLPYIWPGVTISDLDNAIDRKHAALVQQGLASRSRGHKMKLLPVVAKEMHKHQPWFFGLLSRDEAEQYLLQSRDLRDGVYLVREKSTGALALSLLFRQRPWHYKIRDSPNGKHNIDLGPEFDTIMDLITFYHNGGLLCRLSVACERHTGLHQQASSANSRNLQFNPVYSSRDRLRMLNREGTRESRSTSESSANTPSYRRIGGDYPPRDIPTPPFPSSPYRQTATGDYPTRDIPSPPGSAPPYRRAGARNTPVVPSAPPVPLPPPPSQQCFNFPATTSTSDLRRTTHLDLEGDEHLSDDDVYQAVRRAYDDGDLARIYTDQLEVQETLGSGNFGSVRRANFRLHGNSYGVAVKTLRSDGSSHSREDLMKEARLMSKLDNPFIIRLIGVCQSRPESFMLIVELAPEGSLREYLKRHRETPMHTIVDLLHQVARGMAYLERHKVVHRDLAARNVLLHNHRHAKISDFGLSRDLGRFKDYYESTKDEQWPIKWYPPEVIRDKKFASKSDVWSFGITMWEATSYSETPYKGMRADEYIDRLDQGYRMERPPQCPCSLFRIMILCWAQRKEDRPNFREILQLFELITPT